MTLLLDFPPRREMALPADQKWPSPGKWTYEDYRRLPEDGIRYEVIEGVLHMSPAPRIKHQSVEVNLITCFRNFVKRKKAGVVLCAPTDVILSWFATPVQPDIIFIRKERRSIVKEERVEGPPDIVVEILSPSNWLVDRGKKAQVYAQAGVREYWIVDPEAETIELFVLRKGTYVLVGKYGVGETVRSQGLAGFKVKVKDVFEV